MNQQNQKLKFTKNKMKNNIKIWPKKRKSRKIGRKRNRSKSSSMCRSLMLNLHQRHLIRKRVVKIHQ